MKRDLTLAHAAACASAIATLARTLGGDADEADALELATIALANRTHDLIVVAIGDDAIRFADPLLRELAARPWSRAKGDSA